MLKGVKNPKILDFGNYGNFGNFGNYFIQIKTTRFSNE